LFFTLFSLIFSREGYLAFLYTSKEKKEYEEGFGPSVTVRVGGEDTIWKRSRNKWNPFEKIRTLDGVDNEGFTISWVALFLLFFKGLMFFVLGS